MKANQKTILNPKGYVFVKAMLLSVSHPIVIYSVFIGWGWFTPLCQRRSWKRQWGRCCTPFVAQTVTEIPPATKPWNSNFLHVSVEKVALMHKAIWWRNYRIPWDYHNLLVTQQDKMRSLGKTDFALRQRLFKRFHCHWSMPKSNPNHQSVWTFLPPQQVLSSQHPCAVGNITITFFKKK